MTNERRPKFSIEIQESREGQYYLSSLRIDADSVEEMKRLIDLILPRVTHKIAQQNSEKAGEYRLEDEEEEIVLSPNDLELYEYLRRVRNDESRKLDIKPFMIVSNKTLKYMAKERPSNKLEMLEIYGVGDIKFEQYGELFLQAIRDFEEAEGFIGLDE